MRVFLAGMDEKVYRNVALEKGYKNILISYFHSFSKSGVVDTRQQDLKNFDVFLDSGGYTARVRGINIDIDKYANFVKTNGNMFIAVANLDVNDWKTSMSNQSKLESTGYVNKILPVFHFSEFAREDKKGELERFCKEHPYVAIGGTAGTLTSRKLISKYLNFCFSIGMKYKTKFHGFGMTAKSILDHYPFYSVDSTTWMSGLRYNTIFDFSNGKLNGRDKMGKPSPLHFSHYMNRVSHGIENFAKMEQYYTKLWTLRGIKWTN